MADPENGRGVYRGDVPPSPISPDLTPIYKAISHRSRTDLRAFSGLLRSLKVFFRMAAFALGLTSDAACRKQALHCER